MLAHHEEDKSVGTAKAGF